MNKLPSLYQEFIHLSRYSRWLPEQNRRETWEETVSRYFNFFKTHLKERCKYDLQQSDVDKLQDAILSLKVMPSMRCLMTAGPALERDEIAGYNCSFIAVDNPRAFDEILYILSCGTGVGFSVERQYVNNLPVIAEQFHDTETTILVQDSRIGWAKALKELVGFLYQGLVPKYDVSRVRPAGAPLKVFGGRASGPQPLIDLFDFCIKVFRGAAGRKLQSIECHDIVCKIAEVIVVGGVRRSALISLSNLSDDRMRAAKSGQWWNENVQRALANNSACYTEKPDIGIFMDEWKSLYDSKSGERGIFNVDAARRSAEALRSSDGKIRRDATKIAGTNPCAEILLRSKGLCNLSEVVVRADDTKETLLEKVELATILGTFQSTLTNFRYLTKDWQKNQEEERLLGVSLTGILDNDFMSTPSEELQKFLIQMREHAVKTNEKWADMLGIPRAASITCVKPSGTVSQLVDSASGIHARHSEYYVRTVRADNKDPLCSLMKQIGFPNESDAYKPEHTTVFSFPVKSPSKAIFRTELNALRHLELWIFYKKFWAEHTVSITVSVKENEWLDVAAFVYKNFNDISGISFLPFSDHVYKQAPYQDCTKEEYEALLAKMPEYVDWTGLHTYEKEDSTTGTQTLACVSGQCEL
ncbi:RTPR, ribonucleoside-triphosphate reductase, adenosylcobalamin-dependent [uncultured Caudovirales phage]|uniref:ribonucleoside-triphosphate reductase (thioredoxin) n=1 Tax=uncultured Caudovirales phage TaxID=2100421 RepID=A0A6J5M510_9CAUD|nr:RTPR, ribonucleoside-triphosphate reductase, adenosylcobalamin-dependent [uncultured Caudovirales phage]